MNNKYKKLIFYRQKNAVPKQNSSEMIYLPIVATLMAPSFGRYRWCASHLGRWGSRNLNGGSSQCASPCKACSTNGSKHFIWQNSRHESHPSLFKLIRWTISTGCYEMVFYWRNKHLESCFSRLNIWWWHSIHLYLPRENTQIVRTPHFEKDRILPRSRLYAAGRKEEN